MSESLAVQVRTNEPLTIRLIELDPLFKGGCAHWPSTLLVPVGLRIDKLSQDGIRSVTRALKTKEIPSSSASKHPNEQNLSLARLKFPKALIYTVKKFRRVEIVIQTRHGRTAPDRALRAKPSACAPRFR